MDLNNLPTAEEFLSLGLDESGFTLTKSEVKIYSSKLKSFAKMHVKAALESAADETEVNFNDDFYRDKILTCYPEALIK